jgi:hypothetical protein
MCAGASAGLGKPLYQQTIVSHSVGSRTKYNLPGLTQITAPAVDSDTIYERTPGHMTSTLPTLFPDGSGDFYANRLRKLHLGDYFMRT